MRHRLLLAFILLLALFVSAWGNVFAAAFCPHMKSDHACCHATVGHESSSHGMAQDVRMNDPQMSPAVDQVSEGHAVTSQRIETCEHCIKHSQSPATPVALIEAGQAHHSADFQSSITSTKFAPVPTPFTADINSRQHAPPAPSITRHVLINIFRI